MMDEGVYYFKNLRAWSLAAHVEGKNTKLQKKLEWKALYRGDTWRGSICYHIGEIVFEIRKDLRFCLFDW